MSRWRLVVVGLLFAIPLVALMGLGSYYLWEKGLGYWLWWPMATLFVLGYALAWHWQRTHRLLRPINLVPPIYWTERDLQAWHLVEARAKAAQGLSQDQMTDILFYVRTAQDMALELARFYHPSARDPIGNLTLPEILAVVELAAHDLAELVDKYLPGGHVLTIRNWQQAKQATDWYSTFSKVYWLVAAVFSPVRTGLRYATSRLGMSRPWQMLQENLVLWFFTAYIHRLGTYLIDLNSGRLRVGAARYRELINAPSAALAPAADGVAAGGQADPADQVRRVTLTVMGQVKAGKSSLINALLGEQRALTDVLPATNEITRYELQPPGVPNRLVLLDTVGYGHTGPREDQLRATEEAAQQSDLLLLVLHARTPARQADVELSRRLKEWFRSRPELKMPPVLGVMTHIDLLSPALEWSPPYDWENPQRPKEKQIAEALNAVREQLGGDLVAVVPVCTAAGKEYGINEWQLPTVIGLLDEARAVALLRCLKAEANAAKARRVLQQLLMAGGQAVRVWLEQSAQQDSMPPGLRRPTKGEGVRP
jgi:predicted GTPase